MPRLNNGSIILKLDSNLLVKDYVCIGTENILGIADIGISDALVICQVGAFGDTIFVGDTPISDPSLLWGYNGMIVLDTNFKFHSKKIVKNIRAILEQFIPLELSFTIPYPL